MTGKKYIGQTRNENQRKAQHRASYRLHDNKFYMDVRRYGWESFTYGVIEETDEPNERERYWIDTYDTYLNGYNSQIGGGNYDRDSKPIRCLLSFEDGHNELVEDIRAWCEENHYSYSSVRQLSIPTIMTYKDLLGVEWEWE